jgi:hypothetical protein
VADEEKLEAIRKHLWWLSTFLVKVPLFIGCFCLIVLGSREYGSSASESETAPAHPSSPWDADDYKVLAAVIIANVSIGFYIYRWWMREKSKELE